MSVKELPEWWIVSIVDDRTLKVITPRIDAVFAESADVAYGMAATRNPCRQHEMFAMHKVTVWQQKNAIQLNKLRTFQIEEFNELMRD